MSKSIAIVDTPDRCIDCELFDSKNCKCIFGTRYLISSVPKDCKLISADDILHLKYDEYVKSKNINTYVEWIENLISSKDLEEPEKSDI